MKMGVSGGLRHILETKYFLEKAGKAFILHTSQVRSLKSPSAPDPPKPTFTLNLPSAPGPRPRPITAPLLARLSWLHPLAIFGAGFLVPAGRLLVSRGSSIRKPGLFILPRSSRLLSAPSPQELWRSRWFLLTSPIAGRWRHCRRKEGQQEPGLAVPGRTAHWGPGSVPREAEEPPEPLPQTP